MAIDRKALVQRHNPTHNGSFDPMSPFSVGNGDFAVTVDGSGLQTMWHEPLPCLTMANVAWHSFTPERPSLRLKEYDANGRGVGYMSDPSGQEEAFTILRHNPHKANLAKIGFTHPTFDDSNALFEAIGNLEQTLDLYEGTITSNYTLLEEPVHVQTFVHPTKAVLCVSISSPLLTTGLGVEFAFPYPSVELSASDWNEESKHTSILADNAIIRVADDLSYSVTIQSVETTTLVQKAPHRFHLMSEANTLTLTVAFDFVDTPTPNIPFSLALKENRSHWVHFWETGAAIWFNTTDTRAFELERRIILSLYLLAIQSLGSLPPAETGLTVNSWYGKFHLEMHPWHALFAPFWGKGELLKRSLWYYQLIRKSAQKRAQDQGYEGLRWPKMTEPSGSDAPSAIGCLLCWQQPHLILFAVALKRSGFSITEYLDLIEGTITFMISYLQDDGTRLNIGAPVIPAQENHDPVDVLNPTMEIEYWYWALGAGITLVEEAGRRVPDEWKNARRRLALPPISDGLYLAHEKCPDTYTNYATDHPSFLFSYGFIPGERIDPAIMAASLEKTKTSFNLTSMWGWDFPAMAMSATRLGNFHDALELLLLEAAKNTYRVNGHNAQGDRADLPLYLPGNGAILLAVAMMVQHGAFPAQWGVEAEGFYPYL